MSKPRVVALYSSPLAPLVLPKAFNPLGWNLTMISVDDMSDFIEENRDLQDAALLFVDFDVVTETNREKVRWLSMEFMSRDIPVVEATGDSDWQDLFEKAKKGQWASIRSPSEISGVCKSIEQAAIEKMGIF